MRLRGGRAATSGGRQHGPTLYIPGGPSRYVAADELESKERQVAVDASNPFLVDQTNKLGLRFQGGRYILVSPGGRGVTADKFEDGERQVAVDASNPLLVDQISKPKSTHGKNRGMGGI